MNELRVGFLSLLAAGLMLSAACDDGEPAAGEGATAEADEAPQNETPPTDPTGGDPEPQPAEQAAEPTIVTVEELAGLLEEGEAVPVDANGDRTREEQGVIPSARLLTSSSEYDVDQELPAERGTKLVFYCGNEMCSASDSAAERALSAGYTDVNILRAGIAGWKEAGQPTEQPRS